MRASIRRSMELSRVSVRVRDLCGMRVWVLMCCSQEGAFVLVQSR